MVLEFGGKMGGILIASLPSKIGGTRHPSNLRNIVRSLTVPDLFLKGVLRCRRWIGR